MKKILLEDALILSVAKTARFFARVLPLSVSLAFWWALGGAAYFFSKRKHVAYKNLRAAFAAQKSPSEIKRIARRSFQKMALSILEILRFPEMDLAAVERHTKIIGTEKFKPVLEKGQGVIFLTAHFGNWELLNVTSAIIGFPMVALARLQKHPRSDEFLNKLRTSKGSQVIRKGMPVREILRSLKKGKIVGILSDQDGGRKGTFVRFFGRMSSSPSGVVTFAIRTGAPIFPAFDFREGLLEHRMEVGDALKMPEPSMNDEEAERFVLQQFANVLEANIRKSPDQWLWAHRRWKSTPDRFILVLSDGKAGHENQSLAVVQAIKELRASQGVEPSETHAEVIRVEFRNKFCERFLSVLSFILRGRIPAKNFLLKSLLTRNCHEKILKTYADVVIACGSSLSGLLLMVKHLNRAKAVGVMKPSFVSSRFDALVVPRHDRINPSGRVFVTERALSLFSEASFTKEAEILKAGCSIPEGVKKFGLLVGGDTEKIKFSREIFEKFLRNFVKVCEESAAFMLVTTSRRTPSWAEEILKRKLQNHPNCPLLVIANESNRPGVVPGILGLSDAVAVSGESISMLSEAVQSRKPVAVFMPSRSSSLKPKLRRFHESLLSCKQIIAVQPENAYETFKHFIEISNGTAPPAFSDDKVVLMKAVQSVL